MWMGRWVTVGGVGNGMRFVCGTTASAVCVCGSSSRSLYSPRVNVFKVHIYKSCDFILLYLLYICDL